jgi:protein-tyrosine phosphatase
MAEVVFRHLAIGTPVGADRTLADLVEISSAGTGPWHEGEEMDHRTARALSARGYRDHGHVARQFSASRFDHLDLIVALDRRHQQTLRSLAGPRPVEGRITLLRPFDRDAGGAVDVPDPYYDDALFAPCLAMVEAGCRGLAAALAAALAGTPAEAADPSAGRGNRR